MSKHIIIITPDQSDAVEVSAAEADALVDLDWISWCDSSADSAEQFYNLTDQGLSYGGDAEQIVACLHEDFPDVLAAHSLNTSPNVGQLSSFNEMLATVLSIFPNAEAGEDNDGQIVIYTGLHQVRGTGSQALDGPFIKPQPAIGPTPDGYVRVLVLDDGETFSGLAGGSIREVVSEDLADIDDIDDLDPDAWSFVARFDGDGIQV